ncbi:MAG: AAA family ATPase [Candidatus Obscuribacterales bacterium]|nr:AAA family ATPase [Candidatus Obscuribacterales bacterium]
MSKNIIDNLLGNMGLAIKGYRTELELLVYSVFGDGHALFESFPGLAKTLMMRALCQSVEDASFKRIQLTPNLLPTDITGGEIVNPATNEFEIRKGPIFSNMVLADEINRATPKTQSALLEPMAERSVTIAGQTFKMSPLFFVGATMNPIEQEGTFPLPEAQLDRFLFKISLDYVSYEDELAMVADAELRGRNPLGAVKPVTNIAEILATREAIAKTHIAQAAFEYIVKLVRATRPGKPEFADIVARAGADGQTFGKSIATGASPRAINALATAAQVRAFHRGRDHVRPEDIKYVTPSILRHRLLLDRKAKMGKVTADKLIVTLLNTVKFHDNPAAYAKQS